MKERITISISPWMVRYMDLDNTDNRTDRVIEYINKGILAEDGQLEKKNKAIGIMNEDLKIKEARIKELEATINKSKLMQRKLGEIEELAEGIVTCDICKENVSKDRKHHKFAIGIVCDDCFMTGRDSETWFKNE